MKILKMSNFIHPLYHIKVCKNLSKLRIKLKSSLILDKFELNDRTDDLAIIDQNIFVSYIITDFKKIYLKSNDMDYIDQLISPFDTEFSATKNMLVDEYLYYKSRSNKTSKYCINNRLLYINYLNTILSSLDPKIHNLIHALVFMYENKLEYTSISNNYCKRNSSLIEQDSEESSVFVMLPNTNVNVWVDYSDIDNSIYIYNKQNVDPFIYEIHDVIKNYVNDEIMIYTTIYNVNEKDIPYDISDNNTYTIKNLLWDYEKYYTDTINILLVALHIFIGDDLKSFIDTHV